MNRQSTLVCTSILLAACGGVFGLSGCSGSTGSEDVVDASHGSDAHAEAGHDASGPDATDVATDEGTDATAMDAGPDAEPDVAEDIGSGDGSADATVMDAGADAAMDAGADAADARADAVSDATSADGGADVASDAGAGDGAVGDGGGPALVLNGMANTMGAGHPGTAGADGGTEYTDVCPTGFVATGIHGYQRAGSTPYHGPTQVVCSAIGLTGGGPYGVAIGPAQMLLPLRDTPNPGDIAWSRDCPANQVLVSFSGRAGAIIDQLTFSCAPLTVSGTGPYAVSVGTATALPSIGDTGGSAFSTISCPSGQIANGAVTGHDDNAGFGLTTELYSFALVCTTPAVE